MTGRELDALVAEKVMGVQNVLNYTVPNYSTNITEAWEVVEKLLKSSGFSMWKAAEDEVLVSFYKLGTYESGPPQAMESYSSPRHLRGRAEGSRG